MHRLYVRRAPVTGPLHLLRRNENGLTFALGYALQMVPHLVTLLLERLHLPFRKRGTPLDIVLQERDELGITDVEIRSPNNRLMIVLEAKIGGWPGLEQLSRYATYMKRVSTGRKLLVPLGVPPYARDLWQARAVKGVALKRLRWAEVLALVQVAMSRGDGEQRRVLGELAELIQEVTGMRSYDREVLVRDMDAQSPSYTLFFDHDIYACQPNERAEPLFFAPCFTQSESAIQNGIHYVSRVYHRAVVRLDDKRAIQQAMSDAEGLIREQVRVMSRRKGAADDIDYLRTLPAKWRRGVAHQSAHRRRETTAIFFLGDPARLPVPLMKKGLMVPIGFSITWERLMSARPGEFRC